VDSYLEFTYSLDAFRFWSNAQTQHNFTWCTSAVQLQWEACWDDMIRHKARRALVTRSWTIGRRVQRLLRPLCVIHLGMWDRSALIYFWVSALRGWQNSQKIQTSWQRSNELDVVTNLLHLLLFSTTHCSLLRLIVRSWLDVPTFATRRLHTCHHARAPNGGRWNCGRKMSSNFA
jgi:hypothetical protein